jgi:hypothetical protein
VNANQILAYIAMILFASIVCAMFDHPILGAFIFIIGLASIKMS